MFPWVFTVRFTWLSMIDSSDIFYLQELLKIARVVVFIISRGKVY